MPMKRQVLIAFKCFGRYSNYIYIYNIADWVGIGYNIVNFITHKVIITVLDTNLKARHIC